MYPLQRFGIGCEFHAQNTVVRICRKTKAIKGFAVRDLAGIKIHKPTLKGQGDFDLENIGPLCSDDLHKVWDRVHHALIQNNIGYMLYALDLEKTDKAWAIVRSVLYNLLSGGDRMTQDMYRYFVQDTMPFECFLNMRMNVLFGSVSLHHQIFIILAAYIGLVHCITREERAKRSNQKASLAHSVISGCYQGH